MLMMIMMVIVLVGVSHYFLKIGAIDNVRRSGGSVDQVDNIGLSKGCIVWELTQTTSDT